MRQYAVIGIQHMAGKQESHPMRLRLGEAHMQGAACCCSSRLSLSSLGMLQ